MFGQINICSTRTIPKLKTEHFLSNENYFNKKIYTRKLPSVMRMENMNADISGVLTWANNSMLGFNIQINPKMNTDAILNSIREIYEQFREKENNLWGFIAGGLTNLPNEQLSAYSYDTYNKLADLYDALQIPFGMICGKLNAIQKDNVRIHTDKIFLWGDYIKNNLNPTTKDISAIYGDVFLPEDTKLKFISK